MVVSNVLILRNVERRALSLWLVFLLPYLDNGGMARVFSEAYDVALSSYGFGCGQIYLYKRDLEDPVARRRLPTEDYMGHLPCLMMRYKTWRPVGYTFGV